ncbi:MAG: LpxA family transferase, partial [Bacteroidia bacterium]|nr:LpxA family transferase [Bacteroidia bacterium]
LAHFNFIGDSIVGSNINFEAGSITANHFNERESKNISVLMNGQRVDTKQQKFGALVGDGSKIGANAVLSPGTILEPSSIVRRLELVDQLK